MAKTRKLQVNISEESWDLLGKLEQVWIRNKTQAVEYMIREAALKESFGIGKLDDRTPGEHTIFEEGQEG